MKKLIERLKNNEILFLDGAMGTELQVHGLTPGECPETWNLTHPDSIRAIHASYLDAGCNIILTNTFGANRCKLAKFDIKDKSGELNREGARLAKEVVGNRGYVLGDIGPTGELIFPLGELKEEELKEIFIEQVKGLLAGGVDGFILETMWALNELKAIVNVIREASDLPVWTSMTLQPGKNGYRTMMGVTVEEAARGMDGLDCQALGANCGCGIKGMIEIIGEMRRFTKKPILAEPNAGMPKLIQGKTVFEETPEEMAEFVPELIKAGANIIGGCCGTTPAHLKKMAMRTRG